MTLRERAEKVLRDYPWDNIARVEDEEQLHGLILAAIREAVLEEREACARICDQHANARDAAEAIRARSQP